MAAYDFFVPLRTSKRDGFFNVGTQQIRRVLGCKVRLLQQTPYHYLILEDVDKDQVPDLLQKLKRIMPWATLRLDFSILIEPGDIQVENGMTFNGHLPTIVRSGIGACPIRADASHRTEEGDLRLFSALEEAEHIPALNIRTPDPIVWLSMELFTTVDFEATPTAQFLTLTFALELLSRPGDRPNICIGLISQMTNELDKALSAATEDDRRALEDMRSTATQFWITQSFRSAIRALAKRTAEQLGDRDPDAYGRTAVNLYDKRGDVVHRGHSVTTGDVRDIRQLLREVLAVELGCFHHIRERYPLG
jgi:hypothetical protein